MQEASDSAFENDRLAATREAADRLAACFNGLIARKVDRASAQRFLLQVLVALFAEGAGMLKKHTFSRLLDEWKISQDSRRLLGGLFEALGEKGRTARGRSQRADHCSGGLFALPASLTIGPDEIALLRQAAADDWSRVCPEIFGAVFEHSLGRAERHALGVHFTSRADIMKIVGPTIVEPWRNRIENATTLVELVALRRRLRHFTVLDPACGSGNFLYVAYRELNRVEARVLDRIANRSNTAGALRREAGFVRATNFYGIDINAFAVELAKVTMWAAQGPAAGKLAAHERMPALDCLDANFVAADALIDEAGRRRLWPKADVIIGNPPFLGAKRLKPERGPDYVHRIRKLYPEVPGMADYCVYWFRKAHDELRPCTAADPLTGRAGLVGTQNIRSNHSRVGGLDYVVRTGTIVEAVDNQPWPGGADVHVAIVNWVKTQDPQLLPQTRRLWQQREREESPSRARVSRRRVATVPEKRRSDRKDARYQLALRECAHINSALSDEVDLSPRHSLDCNRLPKRCFQGKIPGYAGFLIDRTRARELSADRDVVRPYLTGRELLGDFTIRRWVIDFGERDMPEASAFAGAFEHCRTHVLPAVGRKYREAMGSKSDMAEARREHLKRWWQFWNRRDALNEALGPIGRYIACSRVTRRPVMAFVSSRICPSDLIQVFALDDDYSFGILQSGLHFEWFRRSSRLKIESDVRYSVRSVFETFPWPQSPAPGQVDRVAEAGRQIRRAREAALRKARGGLRAIYRALAVAERSPLRDAHAALDDAVLDAYGFSRRKDVLRQLLALNLELAGRSDAGQGGAGPGIPPGYPKPDRLITDDCIGEDVDERGQSF